MSGISKHGFTLLELLITIAIIGLMAAVVAPNLGKKKAGQERKEFLARLNTLTQLAAQNALIHNKLHKVDFDFKKKTVSLEQASTQKDLKGQPKFEPLKVAHVQTSIPWPEYLHVKNFYIEGFDEASRSAARSMEGAYFFVVPDGMTQRVTINVTDTNDKDNSGRPRKIGLVLNPFNAQFIAHDEFKK